MYLEKLEIQGFKSFANRNVLVFPGLVTDGKRGLTSIVGPNGSGKSNIADSIRWVLGEQSIKTLRGKKSEDVIFSGSDKKNQLSLAEVSLILNNRDRKDSALSTEGTVTENDRNETEIADFDAIKEFLQADEITITRKLYRDGNSEYLINNKRVRLADVQMLLAKASVGQKTYSVIGQGMVENFLNTNAAERKDFFDEATGVKQFQIKRETSLNKLEGSYENLQQVEMLLAEIKPRLKSLTRQVERLKRRSEIETELKNNQLNYYHFLYKEASERLDKANQKFLELEKTKEEQKDKLTAINSALEKIKNTDNFQELQELQPRRQKLEEQKNQLLRQLAKLQAELEVQLEARGQFDVAWLNSKHEELAAYAEKLENDITALTTQAEDNATENTDRENLAAIEKNIAKAYDVKREIEHQESFKNDYLRRLTKLEAILEANLEARGQFDVAWLDNKHQELTKEGKNLEIEIKQLETENSREKTNSLETQIKTITNQLNQLNLELDTIEKELKKPGVAKNNREEISHIVADFLKRLDQIETEIDLTKIKSLLEEAKNEFQSRIEKYLTDENADKASRIKEIQSEIISAGENRQRLNDQLNEERLRLSAINERQRLLVDKINHNQKEAADIEEKIARSQVKFDATAIETEKTELKKSIETFDNKIKELIPQSQTREWQNKKQALLEKINEDRFKKSAIIERHRLLIEKREQTKKEIIGLEEKIARSQVKFDATAIEKQKNDINSQLEKLDPEITLLDEKIETINKAKETEKGEMFRLQNNLQVVQQEINDLTAELNALRIEATRQETKLEDLENNIRNDELDLSEIKNHHLTEDAPDIERWHKKIGEYQNQLEQIGGIDPETEKEYAETKDRFDFLSNQTDDLNNAIKSLEKVISELDINIKDRFDKEFKIISEKFSEYFKILFNGGSARIFKIVDEEKNTNNEEVEKEASPSIDNLKKVRLLKKRNALGLSGIEIQATPPGKKIQTISILSGGERALTAIALICAIISANPSPFVVLDEVDAALDEANSERLAQILDDLSNKTQFIVITHNRALMKRANILYGITMQADGVSKLLSVKLEDVSSRQDLVS